MHILEYVYICVEGSYIRDTVSYLYMCIYIYIFLNMFIYVYVYALEDHA